MTKLNPLDFFEKYKLIGSIELYEPLTPLKCRFCGEESTEFFKNRSHLIPELLGANNFIAKDECDKCNSYFSKFESQLAILARPFLTITNIKTKNKTPVFQSRSDFENQTRTIIKVDQLTSQRQVSANENDIIIDKENDLYEITLRNPGFRPIDVYKALSKITLGLMPKELINENNDIYDWIIGKIDLYEIPHSFQTKLVSKYFIEPAAFLYQAKELIIKDTEYPEFIGVICFANTIIQFYLPISKKLIDKHMPENKMALSIFPSFIYDLKIINNNIFKITQMNLGQKEIFKHDEKFVFTKNNKP